MERPRVLVVRRGALGDTLLVLPVLHLLRAALPGHELWLAGAGEVPGLLRDFGVVDRALSVEDLRLWREDAGADARAELHAELRGFMRVLADVPLALAQATLLPVPVDQDGRPAAAQILVPLAAAVGAHAPFPLATLCAARAVPVDLPEVVIHSGSGSRTKCWPVERFAELARALGARGLRVVVAVGDAEVERGDELLVLRQAAAQTLERPTLAELAARIARARCFVGNDSGVTHLAAALRVPTVAVFGPTDPAVWAPDLPWVTVVGRRTQGPPDAPVAAVVREVGYRT